MIKMDRTDFQKCITCNLDSQKVQKMCLNLPTYKTCCVIQKDRWTSRISGLAGRNEIRATESHLPEPQLQFYLLSVKTTTIMSKSSAQIPVIDISPSNSHAATQLLDAAANNGFVFIENNEAATMPPMTVKNMFNLVNNDQTTASYTRVR